MDNCLFSMSRIFYETMEKNNCCEWDNDFTINLFFYKQLRSGLSPQSWLYFKGFGDSKLFNGFNLQTEQVMPMRQPYQTMEI